MTLNKSVNGTELTIAIEGRLDTNTSPQLDAELKQSLDGITALIFDLKDMAYISSAGLRVLLTAQKLMNKQGKLTVKNANEDVMEIFEVTGFNDILNIE